MKKANLILTGLAISFITINGCKKENLDSLSNSTISGNLSDGSFERRGQDGKGAVYIMDNAVSGNNIVKYNRDKDGHIRLEREGRIIHNYGHGGAGYTLSWGCAEAVAALAR